MYLSNKRYLSIYLSKENWIQGGGNRVSVHFAVTFLDCWRTSLCVTTIIKIVNNNTNDKQTFGASLALDENSPYTNSCLFTLDRLPLLLLLRKNYFSSSPKTSLQSVRKPYFPLLVFNSPWSERSIFYFKWSRIMDI